MQAASQGQRPAELGQPGAHGGLRAKRADYRSAHNLWTNKDWSVSAQGARPPGFGSGGQLAGASTQQDIPRPARLTKEVPVLVGNDINPQGIWVPAERVNGLETVNTPTDRRVSTRSKAPSQFYQAGTDGKS